MIALLDMGDFVGGMLKYMRQNPVPNLSIFGGFGKMVKLAQGALDFIRRAPQVDFTALADMAADIGLPRDRVASANTVLEVASFAKFKPTLCLQNSVAAAAHATALKHLKGAGVNLEIIIVSRDGEPLAGLAAKCHGQGGQHDRRWGAADQIAGSGGNAGSAACRVRAVSDRRSDLIASLAGATPSPLPLAAPVHSGGFGGAEGLAQFCRERSIDAIIDVTHPFARHISRNAAAASLAAEIPCLAYNRPPWRAEAVINGA